MDHTSHQNRGQSSLSSLSADVHMLCELAEFIRAWWREFEVVLRQLDRAAVIKAHDAIIDAVILARRIARAAGFSLPDFSGVNWAVSVPPVPRGDADL